MAEALRLLAPAKINWTLEVLAKRDDGYHDVCTVLQTIDLADTVTVAPAAELSVTMTPDGGVSPQANLAWRAATLLRERFGVGEGASIAIEKRIPIAAGLGGGSSDAAAVLRGLVRLWGLDVAEEALSALAAELGSDVPFFLHGGTAFAEGRGERITPLPDVAAVDLALAPAQGPEGKTARLFGLLPPASHGTGAASRDLAASIAAGVVSSGADLATRYVNSFDDVALTAYPDIEARREALRATTDGAPMLAGAGPSLFAVLDDAAKTLPAGVVRVRALNRDDALRIGTSDGG